MVCVLHPLEFTAHYPSVASWDSEWGQQSGTVSYGSGGQDHPNLFIQDCRCNNLAFFGSYDMNR